MTQQFKTTGSVHVEIQQKVLNYKSGIKELIERLDIQRGALLTSSYEYPGRYTCWDIGFVNPPLAMICRQNLIVLEVLNERGKILKNYILASIRTSSEIEIFELNEHKIQLSIHASTQLFSEEQRSWQPSVFTIIRMIIDLFKSDQCPYLGLYGAFGYDLIYQFETLVKIKKRLPEQRDMVLYLPDEIYVVNHRKEEALLRRYEFQYENHATHGLDRTGTELTVKPFRSIDAEADHGEGDYTSSVQRAKERFACGDLFEVVLSQTFFAEYHQKPSELFKKMHHVNPSPYGFFINLGEGEYLLGASPEMYVRVSGKRVETCPISGTIKRGANAIEDAENIQLLLDSKKEESELTMCTDVDRNDKSRICEAGSVKVIGRRQIEMYSRVIHTVDHVEGTLREGFDAVDAFLSHMWVVTVTGAPKIWAMNFIEEQEKTPRKWYGGAVGWFGFDGNLNTGLILRTVRLEQGIAELRVGATLLYDSVPEHEEQETRLKASAFMDLLKQKPNVKSLDSSLMKPGLGKKILLIDHQDSFVHTLANYFRQTGAEVTTVRYDNAPYFLNTHDYHLVVLSPGPGKPQDFALATTIDLVLNKKIPLFGVCLGLQALVEYFGGDLDILDYPVHGKASTIHVLQSAPLFEGLASNFKAGRYHSLYARKQTFPEELIVSAESDDGIIMAITHQNLPIYAVQFHPETILSLVDQAGLKIIFNLIKNLA